LKSIKKLIKKAIYSNKACYLHIPKTGGTYLIQSESDNETVIAGMQYLGHSVFSKTQEYPATYPYKKGFLNKRILDPTLFERSLIFTTVRNIFDWLVSYYYHAGGHNRNYVNESHYDYDLAQKPFKDFVFAVAERDQLDIWPSKRFIFFQLFDFEGDFVVDWVNHTERLDEDLRLMAFCHSYGYSIKKPQRVARKGHSYLEFYDQELIDLVRKVWHRELSLFGYDFEISDFDSALISGKVSNAIKKSLKYNWIEDKMTINGEVLV
jgi:hypothetical protein